MRRTFRQWQLAQESRNSRRPIERHKPMGSVKGLWVICEGNVWIKFSSMMAGTYSGWSENTRHTSIKNDRIRVLASVFPQSIICRRQSQQVGESPRRQFLADCITAIRVRLI